MNANGILTSDDVGKVMDKPTTELHGPLQTHESFGSIISDNVFNIPYSQNRYLITDKMVGQAWHVVTKYSWKSIVHPMGTSNTR
jgi:hypothetical protein